VPGAAAPGDQAERQFEEAARSQRDGDQQPDLRVAQVQVGANQRERGTFRPVDEFVSELDGQRDCERRDGGVTARAAVPAADDGGDRSTSHAPIVTCGPPATVAAPKGLRDRLRTRSKVQRADLPLLWSANMSNVARGTLRQPTHVTYHELWLHETGNSGAELTITREECLRRGRGAARAPEAWPGGGAGRDRPECPRPGRDRLADLLAVGDLGHEILGRLHALAPH